MQLNLTVEQINIVLQSLAAQPYQAVAAVIAEIQSQAREQAPPSQPAINGDTEDA